MSEVQYSHDYPQMLARLETVRRSFDEGPNGSSFGFNYNRVASRIMAEYALIEIIDNLEKGDQE